MMDDFLDIVRREAVNAVSSREGKGTVLCTAYNPKTYAIKGILMPHEVETGWIPVSVAHAGVGFGILVGPKVGDPQKAADGFDGDVFDVEFEDGDPNTPVAKLKHFSAQDTPPEVQSGEILIKREDGGSVFMDKDGQITVAHKSGGVFKFDKDGNASVTTKDMSITVDAGQGAVTYKAKSHSFEGDTSMQGNLTASGTVTGSNIVDSSDGQSV